MSRGSEPVRTVVLGLGQAGRVLHIPAMSRVDGMEVVAAADPDARTHAGLECPTFTDWRQALAVPADAAVVAAPPAFHAELATAALEQGLHLYLEKPVATSLDEARAMAAAVPRRTVVQIGFAYRFHPLWRRVAAMAAAGRIRLPLRATGRFSLPRPGTGWSAPVIDVSCHHIDALSSLIGSHPIEVDAGADGRLRASWSDGSVLDGTYAAGVDEDWVVLDDGQGPVRIDRRHGTRLEGGSRRLGRYALPAPGLAAVRRLRPDWERSFEFAFRSFRDAVRRGAPLPSAPGMEAGVAAVAVAEAILASMAAHRPVAVRTIS